MKSCHIPLLAVLASGVAVICGCRSPMKDYEASLTAGDYAKAAAVADEEISEGANDELMWRLMSGGAHRLAGAKESAVVQFDRAEDVMIGHDGTSVFSSGATGAWAMMTNDKAFPYEGGGQDRIFTCLYKAIDFAAAGDAAAARTELNRAAQHQENWLFERRKDIVAAGERMEKDVAAYRKAKQQEGQGVDGQSQTKQSEAVVKAFADADFAVQVKEKCGFDMATSGVLDTLQPIDWMNPYISHVTGVFRWLNGDDARNHLKDAATCRTDNAIVARDFAECDKGEKPSDQVWIWVEDGLGPRREEWRLDLPIVLIPYANRYVLYAGMALPYLEYRAAGGNGWKVRADGVETPMNELVDMDAKMKLEFDVYFRGALAREITRTIVKIGTQVALGVVAENTNDWRTQYALRAAQIAAAAWAASVTGADTRSWTTLPKKIHVARVARPASRRIAIASNAGPVAEVELPPGNAMVFVTKPSVLATPAVKVVACP